MKPIEKIDKVLEARGMSTRALADLTGISENRISKWRRPAGGKPSQEDLTTIADALDLPRAYLLDPTMTEIPRPELTDGEQTAVLVIRSLALPIAEVIRRLYHVVPSLPPTMPVAEHHGRDGTPPRSGVSSKSQDKAPR